MIFISRKKSYKIILQAKRFVLTRDQEKLLLPGLKVTFQGGQFETDDKELIEKLKNTKYFGVDYFIAAGQEEAADNTPTPEGKALQAKAKQASEDTLRACPYCAFNAQSKIGLISHIKSKHPDKEVPKI